MGRKLECPSCGSLSVEAVAGPKKKMSISKGIVGGVLLGPLGAVAGGAGLGKRGKATLHCMECGEVWDQKL